MQACDPSTGFEWEYLGLQDRSVTSLTDTPWGLFAGTADHGVFVRDSATGAWQALGLDHAAIQSLLFIAGTPSRLLAGVVGVGTEQTDAAVFASPDTGQTWLPWDGGLALDNDGRQWAYALASDPNDPTRLFLGQSGSILRSYDGGRTWEYVFGSPDIFGNGIFEIVVSPQRDGRIWAGGGGAIGNSLILSSEDWGDNWQPVIPTPGPDIVLGLAVDPTDPVRLWAGHQGGVIRSSDAGRTWHTVLDGLDGLVSTIIVSATRLWAVGGTFRVADSGTDLALQCSMDAGERWLVVAPPQGATGSDAAAIGLDGRLLVGTVAPGGGVWRLSP